MRRGVLAGAALLLAGCASFRVVDTVPLPAEKLLPVGAEAISRGGYRLASLAAPSGQPGDTLILAAMSGGGKRSAAFAYGVLRGMREIMVPTASGPKPMLTMLDGISGISGGSFTAAYYGLYRDQMFGRYENDFLYRDTNAWIWGIYLLPWNWTWLVDPTVGTNDYMERVYDQTLFHGATYRDLQAKGRPVIVIGATDIAWGTPFVFTQDYFDYLCSDLQEFPLARAVAASNGFPGLFSPVTLTNRAEACGGRRPGWLRDVGEEERNDPFSRRGLQARIVARYLDPAQTRYAHLSDGGISDNLGLRTAGQMMSILAASPRRLATMRFNHVRRVLVISIDGQGAQDETVAQRRLVGGLFAVLGLVSGGQIDRYNFETLYTVRGQVAEAVDGLRRVRCAKGAMVDGAPCADVRGALVHVALAELPDSPEKRKLLAIPTGLSIGRADADLLVHAGEQAVVNSTELREFLAGAGS